MKKEGESKLTTLIDIAHEYIEPYMELRQDPELLRVRCFLMCDEAPAPPLAVHSA